MKVLILVHGLPVGGTERMVTDLVRWLRARDVSVWIGCLDELGTFGEALAREGVPCRVFGRRPGTDLRLPGHIAAWARQTDIDLLHAHQYSPYFYGVLATFLYRRPILFTEHGRFHPDLPSTKRRIFNRTVGKRVDHITAVSSGVRDSLVRVEGFAPARIEVLHNGLNPESVAASREERRHIRGDLGIPMEAPVVGTVARLNPIKNQRLLIDAFGDVVGDFPDAHLVIVGDGEAFAALSAQAAERGLRHAVHLVGGRDDVPAWLAAMDVFALSSLSEGMPMTILEAMAAGVPVVTTDVGGIREVLAPDEEGLFVPSGDRAAFAGSLKRLLDDPALRTRLAGRARARMERQFSLDAIGGRYLDIYRNLLARRAA